MSVTSLENKTVRPGSLVGYSYYHSARRPYHAPKTASLMAGRGKLLRRQALIVVLVLLAGLVGTSLLRGNLASNKPATVARTGQAASTTSPKNSAPAAAPGVVAAVSQTTNHCADNNLDQLVLVSISQRHLWACQGSKTLYDSPVITGIEAHASTLTPPGTYHVSAKQTDLTLTGSDVTGSWSDPVQYWMPFLSNQYGTYGFHDATWRQNSAFGNISPNSSDASHGCVELPLASAKWLYTWVQIGTTVTIKS